MPTLPLPLPLPRDFAIVGFCAAPGQPDSPAARAERAAIARAIVAVFHGVEAVETVGTYQGESEPGILLHGGPCLKVALVIGRALSQESVFCGFERPDGSRGAALLYCDGRPLVSLGDVYRGPSPDGDETTAGPFGTFHAR